MSRSTPDLAEFTRLLDNLRSEAYGAAHYVYSEMTVEHAASKSKVLLKKLSANARFWNAHRAACQVAAYICLSRVFDRSSKYNIHKLLDWVENNQQTFTRLALGKRRQAEAHRSQQTSWIVPRNAVDLTRADIRRLRAAIDRREKLYRTAVQPARHQHIAHRVKVEEAEVQKLYASGKISDLWKLVVFLHAFHEAIWQLYANGRAPKLQRQRYSVKRIFEKPSLISAPHESIVRDTQDLMARIARSSTA